MLLNQPAQITAANNGPDFYGERPEGPKEQRISQDEQGSFNIPSYLNDTYNIQDQLQRLQLPTGKKKFKGIHSRQRQRQYGAADSQHQLNSDYNLSPVANTQMHQ